MDAITEAHKTPSQPDCNLLPLIVCMQKKESSKFDCVLLLCSHTTLLDAVE